MIGDLTTMEKTMKLPEVEKNNKVKLYGVIIGLVSLAAQHGIYLLGHILAGVVGIAPFVPKIAAIDNAIPIIPIFIIPYVWAYVTWGMAPMAASKCEVGHFKDYLAAYLFACLFGALILVFAPTYMDRVAEGLYDTTNTGFFWWLMRFWYSLDGSEIAYNLFPSFHCINSTMAYLAVAGRKEVPVWFRVYSLIMAFLVYAATVFVKQHFFIDIIGGVVIAVIAFIICKKCRAGRIFDGAIKFYNEKIKKKKAA